MAGAEHRPVTGFASAIHCTYSTNVITASFQVRPLRLLAKRGQYAFGDQFRCPTTATMASAAREHPRLDRLITRRRRDLPRTYHHPRVRALYSRPASSVSSYRKRPRCLALGPWNGHRSIP